ncbi:MAG: substrate-binding domain-containing protein [Thermoleophilia bacterium]|nr:substrate-binding domain-containing protein [Thermoleophilia bacterium]
MSTGWQGSETRDLKTAARTFACACVVGVLAACAALFLGGCAQVSGAAAAEARTDLVLASTTSTQDSGLFEVLVPAFETLYPYRVKVIAVGSGEALALGARGDADVLLVHSPAAEESFMQKDLGVERRPVMYNDFVIVGPHEDPARIGGCATAAAAFAKIAQVEAPFFSRGDHSGTHDKELSVWEAAGINPVGKWYRSTGQGMGETLTIADQVGGYTLADRATFLSKKEALPNLEILLEKDPVLFNQYHVITVRNARNLKGATDFTNWIVSEEVQKGLIAGFGLKEFGQPLFVPNAGEGN